MWRVVALAFVVGLVFVVVASLVDGLGGLAFAGVGIALAGLMYAAVKNPALWR